MGIVVDPSVTVVVDAPVVHGSLEAEARDMAARFMEVSLC
jgi:hypothetical protein